MGKIGVPVTCRMCGHMKKPVGRSGALGAYYCERDTCAGYDAEPFPGSLWPDETEEEFGYAVSSHGTRETG